MSVISISRNAKAPIQTAQHVRNGKYPAAEIQNLIADRAGQWAWTRPKLVYRTPGFIIGTAGAAQIPSSVVGSRYRWRFAYHAGPFAQYLAVHFQMVPQNNAGTPADPIGRLELSTAPDYSTIVATAEVHWGSSDGSYTDVPINMGGGDATFINSAGNLFGLTPLTNYFGRFVDVDYGRIQSASCWEISMGPDTNNGYAPNNVGSGTPIFDEDRADPADMGKRMWAYGAQPLWHWATDTDAGVRTQGLSSLSGSLVQTISPFTLSAAGTVSTTPPVYQATTSVQTSTGPDVTLAWPSHAVNDVALLFIASDNNATIELTTANGFTLIDVSNNNFPPMVACYWHRATSTSMSAPVVSGPSSGGGAGTILACVMLTFRGCVSSGDPWDVKGYLSEGTASTTASFVHASSTVSNTLTVIGIGAHSAATIPSFSGWTNANLTSLTERADGGAAGGTEGGISHRIAIAVATGGLAAAGSLGTTTSTISTSSAHRGQAITLKP